jgi:hypothetical protein
VAAFFTENILDASEDNSRMLIDRNGTKWMANRDGVVGFNESNNTFKKNDDRHGYWKFTGFRC